MDKVEKIIKLITPVVAVIIPCILLAGYSYHLGYIMSFGLSSDLIYKSMSEVIVESWTVGLKAMVWAISKWAYLVAYLVILYFVFVITFFWFKRQHSKGSTWLFDEVNNDNQGKIILGISQWHWVCLIEAFQSLFSWFAYPAMLLLGIAIFTVFPFKNAQQYAMEQIASFEQHGCASDKKQISCIYLINRENQEELTLANGLLVSANEDKIAIYNTSLEIWPLLDSYIIKKKPVETDKVKKEVN